VPGGPGAPCPRCGGTGFEIVEKDGRVVQVDPYGNRQLHKQQHKVQGRKVYDTDAYGRVKQQKFEIKKEQYPWRTGTRRT
jgi:hypothetical protein